MFASSSLAILISAATVLASTHQAARNHHEIAKRLDNTTSPLDKRAQFTNQEFTWYPTDTGPYVQFSLHFPLTLIPIVVMRAREKTTRTVISWVSSFLCIDSEPNMTIR
jgi:hypothetical protein